MARPESGPYVPGHQEVHLSVALTPTISEVMGWEAIDDACRAQGMRQSQSVLKVSCRPGYLEYWQNTFKREL